jgi:hypothetical protein
MICAARASGAADPLRDAAAVRRLVLDAQCPVIVIAREPQERPAPQAQASAART